MIFLKDKEIIPFKADHEPIGIYVGDKAIFEPIEVVKSGNDIELNNTYNHKLDLSIQGNSVQKREYLKTVTDNIIQVESERAVVELRANENLLKGTSEEWSKLEQYGYEVELTEIEEPLSPNGKAKKCIITAVDPKGYSAGGINYELDNITDMCFSLYIKGKGSVSVGKNTQFIELQEDYVKHSTFMKDRIIRMYSRKNAEKVEFIFFAEKSEYADLPLKAPTPWIPHASEGTRSIQVTHCGRNLFETKVSNFSVFSGTIQNNKVSFNNSFRYLTFHMKPQLYPNNKDYTLSYERSKVLPLFIGKTGTSAESTQFKTQSSNNIITKGSLVTNGLNENAVYFSRNFINNINEELYQDVISLQVELGDTPHPYEEYKGETLTIPFNTPTVVSMYKGVNTFFADEPISLTYTTDEQTDEQTPTPLFPSEVHSSYEGEGEGVVVNDKLYTIPILRSVGDVRDTFENGVYTQRIKKIRLTSSLTWYNYVGTLAYYTHSITDCIPKEQSSVCTHFPNINRAWEGTRLSYSDHDRVKFKYFCMFTSKEDFLKFLDDNEVYLYYILETPIINTLPYDLKTKPRFTRVRSVSEVGARVEAKALVYEL